MEKKKIIFLLNIFILLNVFNFFLPASTCLAGENPKFLFQEDDAIKSEQPSKNLTNKSLKKNIWFNSPPTRLELLIFLMDYHYKNQIKNSQSYLEADIRNSFEEKRIDKIDPEASVFYDSSLNYIGNRLKIEILGKPKIPMSETCKSFLNDDSLMLGHRGYSMQNTFLHPFTTNGYDDAQLLDSIDEIIENLIYIVSLRSNYDNRIYILECYKTAKDNKDDVKYFKASIDFKK